MDKLQGEILSSHTHVTITLCVCVCVLTERVLGAGLAMEDLVAVHVYVADMAQFARINAVYKTYFTINPPIRCVTTTSTLTNRHYAVGQASHQAQRVGVHSLLACTAVLYM